MNKRQRKKDRKKELRKLGYFLEELTKKIVTYSGIDLRHITPTGTSTAYEYAKNFYSPATVKIRRTWSIAPDQKKLLSTIYEQKTKEETGNTNGF